jgi:hypothetical protein
MKKVNKAQQIREYITANPDAKGTDIAKKFKVGTTYVYQVRAKMKSAAKPKKIIIGKYEAEVAKKLGIPLEEYAKQRMNLAYEVSKGRPKIRMQSTVDRKLPEVGDSVGGLTLTRKISDDGNGYAYTWVRDELVASGEVPVDSHEDPRVPQFDTVNHPAHYKVGGIETIDFIDAKQFGYNLGNVIKYVSRADHKDNKVEDLKKAQWYLNREISKLTGEKA